MSIMDDPFDFERYEQELGLSETIDKVEAEQYIDVSKMNPMELLDVLHETEAELAAMNELHCPHSDEARRLHSVRAACRIALNNRQ